MQGTQPLLALIRIRERPVEPGEAEWNLDVLDALERRHATSDEDL